MSFGGASGGLGSLGGLFGGRSKRPNNRKQGQPTLVTGAGSKDGSKDGGSILGRRAQQNREAFDIFSGGSNVFGGIGGSGSSRRRRPISY